MTTWEYPVADWKQVLDINLTGVFLCNKALVPHMQANDYGRIVNIASIAGKEGNPNASAYSASKAGVISLTKSLGKELAKTGIRVNCVTPAAVKTGMFAQMTQAHIDFMLSKIPMGRFGAGRGDRRAGGVALHRGLLVLDRRGVRPVGRPRGLLAATRSDSGPRAPITFDAAVLVKDDPARRTARGEAGTRGGEVHLHAASGSPAGWLPRRGWISPSVLPPRRARPAARRDSRRSRPP